MGEEFPKLESAGVQGAKHIGSREYRGNDGKKVPCFHDAIEEIVRVTMEVRKVGGAGAARETVRHKIGELILVLPRESSESFMVDMLREALFQYADARFRAAQH